MADNREAGDTMSREDERGLRCRLGWHRWGLWMGAEWHGIPTWHVGGPTQVVCKRCGCRGRIVKSDGHAYVVKERRLP